MENWMIPTRFTVGERQGLRREEIVALGKAAAAQGLDPRVLAARMISDGLRRLRVVATPDNVAPGDGWGYPVGSEG